MSEPLPVTRGGGQTLLVLEDGMSFWGEGLGAAPGIGAGSRSRHCSGVTVIATTQLLSSAIATTPNNVRQYSILIVLFDLG